MLDAARQLRMEDKVGSLEEGKYADIVVLDGNLFKVESAKIAEIKAAKTMMNWRFTYEAGKAPQSDRRAQTPAPDRLACCSGHRIPSPQIVAPYLAAS